MKNEIVKAKRAIAEAKKKTKAAYSGMFSKVRSDQLLCAYTAHIRRLEN